jgi:hypothetical protein
MTSPTTLAVLFFLAFLVLLQRRRVARSELEPLKVRIIPPKTVDVVVSAMAEPLRAPVPSVSSVVAGAQRLSISDPTAGVDDLLSSFSSFSMKACHLRSCCKSHPLFDPSFSWSLWRWQRSATSGGGSPIRVGTIRASPTRFLPLPFATRV